MARVSRVIFARESRVWLGLCFGPLDAQTPCRMKINKVYGKELLLRAERANTLKLYWTTLLSCKSTRGTFRQYAESIPKMTFISDKHWIFKLLCTLRSESICRSNFDRVCFESFDHVSWYWWMLSKNGTVSYGNTIARNAPRLISRTSSWVFKRVNRSRIRYHSDEPWNMSYLNFQLCPPSNIQCRHLSMK